MMTQMLAMLRELDSRTTDGIHVRMLWCEHERRVSVTVADTKTQEAFVVEVRDGESPRDVFHHPYAYAAWHGIELAASRTAAESVTAIAA